MLNRIKLTPSNPVEKDLGLYIQPQAMMVIAQAKVPVEKQTPEGPALTDEMRMITQIILFSGQVMNVLETPEEIDMLEAELEGAV